MYEYLCGVCVLFKGIPGFVGACAFFVYGGIWGVLPDLDHPLGLLAQGLPLTWQNLCTQAGRMFHVPGLILLGAAFVLGNALTLGWVLARRP